MSSPPLYPTVWGKHYTYMCMYTNGNAKHCGRVGSSTSACAVGDVNTYEETGSEIFATGKGIYMYMYIQNKASTASSQSRLAELYQSASQEAQSKVDELLRGADSMQQILEDVSQEKEKFEMQLNEAICRCIVYMYSVHVYMYTYYAVNFFSSILLVFVPRMF